MTARDLIEIWAARLFAEQKQLVSAGSDEPIAPVTGRLLQAVGTLYLYEFRLPPGRSLAVDTPLSIVPPDDMEPTEGVVLSCRQDLAVVQTFDMIGRTVEAATIIPDRGGFLATSATRLTEMLTQPDAYRLGPADRLVPLLEASSGADETGGSTASILTTIPVISASPITRPAVIAPPVRGASSSSRLRGCATPWRT